ncbi:MAG: HTTM domain-containing protein [Actinomycetota bacterium]
MPTATAEPRPTATARRALARCDPLALRPAGSYVAFRVAFGVLIAIGQLRFVLRGWVEEFLLAPEVHLTYPGFAWVRPLPPLLMYGLVGGLGLAGVAIALGWRTRPVAAVFAVGFAYTELIDAALYLNHYWFMTLAAVVLVVVPGPDRGRVPAITVWALRGQLAVVYLFAGVAKLNEDWLLRGEPLSTWLAARTDRPIIGPLLDEPIVGMAFSWAGAVFDLTIVGWLLWSRSRPVAYGVLVAFHVVTAMLFQIGMFPWMMILLTPIFCSAEWPARLLERMRRGRRLDSAPNLGPETPGRAHRTESREVDRSGRAVGATMTARRRTSISRRAVIPIAVLALVNLVLPIRHAAADGDVRWNDDGYLLSWRVMLTERATHVRFHLTDPATGATETVDAESVLTEWQAAAATVRADLILTTAHLIADQRSGPSGPRIAVHVDAFVAWNGRVRERWIRPDIDLAALSRAAPASAYVLPAP